MSAEATGWVFRHSPLTGVEFTIHLSIADSVNDQNEYEFWMKQGNLAEKARTTRETVNRSIQRMLDLGLLIEADNGPDSRKSKHQGRCFRFTMPTDVTRDHIECDERSHRDVTRDHIVLTQEISQVEPKPLSRTDRFDEFWEAYPLKKGKGAARKAWAKIKVDPDLVIAAALAYRNDPNRDDDFTKWPQGWLNDERWDDELLPSVPHRRQTRTQRNLMDLLTEDRPSREERFRAAGALDALETSGRPALVGLTAIGSQT